MTDRRFGSRRVIWFALIGAWAAAISALLLWLTRTPPPVLRAQLIALQFWTLELCVLMVLALGALLCRGAWRHVRPADVLSLAALAATALVLTVFVAPRTNRIYYDEQIYQSIGQNLTDLRRAQICLDGNVEYGRLQCSLGEYNKQPYAYPHLLSLVYRVAGVDARWAFLVNAVAMAATTMAVYAVVLLLFASRAAALFAGLIVTLMPQQLLWSATAAVEPLASLACIVAVLATVNFTRTRTTLALLAAGVATTYAVQFRLESLLIVPIILCLLWQLARDEFRHPRLWWVALFCLALAAAHVGHLYSVRNEGWGTSDARLSLRYVVPNLRVNAAFYAGDERFPMIYTLLALVGLFASGQVAPRFAMLLYFLSFFGMGLLFYAGSYNYGADVRYSLMTYPPLALLAGFGASRLADWAGQFRRVPARQVVICGLVFQFLWYMPVVRATTEEAWAARADVRFAESLVGELPSNSYVLTHNPGMFHLWGVNAGQMSLLTDPGRLHFLARQYSGGVYLHWNFWCNVLDPLQQRFCLDALAMSPTRSIREHRERDYRFGLYRFEVPNEAGNGTGSRW